MKRMGLTPWTKKHFQVIWVDFKQQVEEYHARTFLNDWSKSSRGSSRQLLDVCVRVR